ncbi:putative PPPDE peptidase domain-containing protein [Helianthus annuus]|nr:putative PPPDE peptidase domain-containing protein [Helianthus annuus]KAJ0617493.1 putative PPPDE peptidase domain-containing protein [Helianthus annuus]KAJ0776031.1 putative PPPDE peptidase domain-containing protein [Helianthus annuus]KAJ0938420.1 putative PPPDE peptidase domain-containing protein [Helianthus annuus]
MLCRGRTSTSTCRISGSVPVYLNVYDLSSMNGCAYWLGLGVYHSGVQDTSSLGPKARGYGDGPPREDDPPRRRHVIVLLRMVHPTKVEGMRGWSISMHYVQVVMPNVQIKHKHKQRGAHHIGSSPTSGSCR